MNWKSEFNQKLTTPDEAVKTVCSNQRVFLTGNCSVPRELLRALVKRAADLTNVEICQPLTITDEKYTDPSLQGHLKVNTLFVSPNVRGAVNQGEADFTPVLLSQLPSLFSRRILPVDVAFLHLSPPDENGYCSYGLETGLVKTASESARIRVAEINPRQPFTFGESLVHISQIDHFVSVDYPLAQVPLATDPDEQTVRIAQYVADLIPDGATLQLGIGDLPNTILRFLSGKKDLGIHAELVSDGIIPLVAQGVINGSRKTLNPGKIIAGFGFGTRSLHQWIDRNELVELHRTEYVNSPAVIAQHKNMVSVNSAIEIDLTGQVCADSIGTKFFSGVGGQMDFIYGASLSENGFPIIALPSYYTASDGSIRSRINPMLKAGAGVTTSRNHVHYVATEHGIVDLFGKTIRERAKFLISIADPRFREDLLRQASLLHYL